jgi:hypothetical protein
VKTPPTFPLVVLAILTLVSINSSAQENEALRQRVLRMSHSTRIDETGKKPWHMRVNFQLYDEKGKPSEAGTLEEWWTGPQLWKMTIESPSYKSTTVENNDGDFRTSEAGPIPMPIRAMERNLVYPAPMGEDLSRTMPRLRRERLDGVAVDCIQLGEPTTVVQFPVYCLDPVDNGLKEIYSAGPWSMTRNRTTNFNGSSVAMSITVREGKRITASAEITDLSELSLQGGMYTPTPDMKRVHDMHTFRVTTTK